MEKSTRAVIASALLAVAGVAQAQTATPGSCPALPADSGLTWETKNAGGTQFCRAMRSDGSEAFGLYIAKQTAFKPTRGNRAEETRIDGRDTYWYRSEIAGQPDLQARETAVALPDGRVAYLWIQAKSNDELRLAITQSGALKFDATTQLSSN